MKVVGYAKCINRLVRVRMVFSGFGGMVMKLGNVVVIAVIASAARRQRCGSALTSSQYWQRDASIILANENISD